MSSKKEFSASSLKEAIVQAAETFNVKEDQIKYEIVTEKTRYFGHTHREIYIRAWLSDGAEESRFTDFIKQMIREMDLDLEYHITAGKGFVRVDFNGEDYRLMLYKNGNLLNAVQYLLNRLFSDEIGKKIYCECEKFRKNREYELTNLAHRYARSIRKTGRPIILKELNPFERRVIHMTINKYADLESVSKGDNFTKVMTIRKK
ncbi:MAG: R3H domain-containing nucleic acid-binding protein [Candidatus Omnitrophota bacterium]